MVSTLALCSNMMKDYRLIQAELEQPHLLELAHGISAMFSRRSPGKDTVNEDASAIIPVDDNAAVLVVADGVGGQQAGDVAARIAIESIAEALGKIRVEQSLRDSVLDGIENANNRIIEAGRGSATTLVVAEIQGKQLRTYYVGDSLVLLCGQKGKLKFQNVAHSPVGYALESGLIDEEEAIHHEERNLVSNVLGTPEMSIEMGPVLEMSPRDTLVLSSDSLPDNLYIDEIVGIVRAGKLANAADKLIELVTRRMSHEQADQPCKPDDFTFMLYRRT